MEEKRKKEYLIGKAGAEYIKNALSTKQPRQVFEEIQHSYGIWLPNDKYFFITTTKLLTSNLQDKPARLPVLDLLDLHKVPRAKVILDNQYCIFSSKQFNRCT